MLNVRQCASLKSNLKFSSRRNLFSSEKNAVELKLVKLESHLKRNAIVSKGTFLSLYNQIEKRAHVLNETPRLALKMLDSCGQQFVGLFPHQRQYLLDNLFNRLFAEARFRPRVEHYEAYLSNTHANRSQFDPLLYAQQMHDHKIEASSSISYSLIKQLCLNRQIGVALAYLNLLINNSDKHGDARLNLNELKSMNRNFLLNDVNVCKLVSYNNNNNNNNSEMTNVFNPILEFYLANNHTDKCLECLELIDALGLRPNSLTYLTVIRGYLSLRKFDEAFSLYEKTRDALTFRHTFDLYTSLGVRLGEKEAHEFFRVLGDELSKFGGNFQNIEDRVFVANVLMHLAGEKRFDFIYAHLMRKYFASEFDENDPVKIDIINQRIDLSSLFFKSLVEFGKHEDEQQLERLSDKYAQNERKHLKTLLHYVLKDEQLSTDRKVRFLHKLERSGAQIKTPYFFPMFLVEKKSNKNEQTVLSNFRLLIERMSGEFRLRSEFGLEHKIDFLRLLQLDADNSCANRRFSYLELVKLFPKPPSVEQNRSENEFLFSVCATQILRASTKVDTPNLQQVERDLSELVDLIDYFSINSFRQSFFLDLHKYMSKLYEKRLDINASLIERLIVLSTKTRGNTQRINMGLRDYLKESGSHLLQVAETNLGCDDEPSQNASSAIEKPHKKQLGIDILNERVEPIAASENNDLIRKTLNRLTSDLIGERVEKRLAIIEQLLAKLPEQQLTPFLCENLIHFYSKSVRDFHKAEFYFNALARMPLKADYYVSVKAIAFIEFYYLKNGKESLKACMEMFSKFEWKNPNNDFATKLALGKMLSRTMFSRSSGAELNAFLEHLFRINFTSRSEQLCSILMLKYLQEKNLSDAYEYFKINVARHKLSPLEIVLLKESLGQRGQNKQQQQQQQQQHNLLQNRIKNYFEKNFDQQLLENMKFFAQLLNGNVKRAELILNEKLNGRPDSSLLKRLVSQFQLVSNRQLIERHCSRLFDLLDFEVMRQADARYRNEIEKSLREISKKL